MKAAAKPTPWLFPQDAAFPVIGSEQHPLKRFGRRLLLRGMIVGMLLHIVSFGGWLVGRSMESAPPPAEYTIQVPKRIAPTDLRPPPSLAQNPDAAAAVEIASVGVATIGVPEPVPDFQATTSTVATAEQIAEALQPVDMSQVGSSTDSLVIDESIFTSHATGPENLQTVDELPVPISTPLPSYPDIARASEIESSVKVRARVTKEGTVSDVIVLEGNFLLHDAAIAAVKQWTFKPAMHQHKPVQVWVEIPLDFTLD